MKEDDRIGIVKDLLFAHVKSPSVKHIRDPYAISRLATEIVRRVDRGNSIWRKWTEQRELLLKCSIPCWIPVEDMRDFLNEMPGPKLTTTDVTQRFRALEDEETEYAHEEFKAGCLAIYEKEKAEGTEITAIVNLLRQYVDDEEDRKRREWDD